MADTQPSRPKVSLLRLSAAISCFAVCYHLVRNVIQFAGKMKRNYDPKMPFLPADCVFEMGEKSGSHRCWNSLKWTDFMIHPRYLKLFIRLFFLGSLWFFSTRKTLFFKQLKVVGLLLLIQPWEISSIKNQQVLSWTRPGLHLIFFHNNKIKYNVLSKTVLLQKPLHTQRDIKYEFERLIKYLSQMS